LNISEFILREHLIPRDYHRPRIEIRNYYLKWKDDSFAISQKEVDELKRFLSNVIPLFDTSLNTEINTVCIKTSFFIKWLYRGFLKLSSRKYEYNACIHY
jgi:hypothetical protein